MDKLPGRVVVLTGPSGAGKTTLATLAVQRGLAESITTCTTRHPRPGERDGVDYRFLTVDKFQAMYLAGELLERECIHGNWYGAPRDEFERAFVQGRTVVVPMGFDGACAVKKIWPINIELVFVAPPSVEELRCRLEARGEGAEEMEKRLGHVEDEMHFAESSDAIIYNKDREQALLSLKTLITGKLAP